MKKLTVLLLSAFTLAVHAQNVGIGSPNPQKKLTVNGSILLDENNTNDGAIDSAALLFGRFDGRLAIGGAGLPEYKFHNNGNSYFGGSVNISGPTSITGLTSLTGSLNVSGYTIIDDGLRINGNIGLHGPSSGSYALFVHSLPSYFQGITTAGSATIGTSLNVNGDGIVDNNFRVNGRVGINGATNANYGLIVNNANSYFQVNATIQGNTTVQGSTNLQGNVTIQGNGHVRSNGNSSLRIGFETVSVTGSWNGKQEKNFNINLPDFGTNPDNIRVSVAQFNPEAWVTSTSDFKWYIYNVNHTSGTAQLRVINESSGLREFFGIFYILIVVKDI